MNKIYPPHLIEKERLNQWNAPGYFSPKGQGEAYCIVLPPPNVTGVLHMGHGFQVSLMDALVRYYRMRGYQVLWQGGVDHAGIATQMVVERQLLSQGKTRHSIQREELLALLSDWKDQSEAHINSQLRRMGASIDFERNRFTLDTGFVHAVKKVLVQLHQDDLLYRGKRLVNWDPHLLTAISDLEVIHTEEAGWMYSIEYPLVSGVGGVTVATTRPETLFGDVAIAVHPSDQRYQSLIGQFVSVPLTDRTIPIIEDMEVDPAFGTGCVKITPAHDFKDYKIGQRHQLPCINILTPQTKLNEAVPPAYQGLDCVTAREQVIEALSKNGQLRHKVKHMLQVPRGDRSGAIIEPYLTDQWFIRSKPLAEKAICAIQSREVTFASKQWEGVSLQWLTQMEDWCISRQLWWGHQMPAWYTPEGKYLVGMSEAEVRHTYQIDEATPLTQDTDVLDTWVSAALWPFVTLGWPDATKTLETFYPTSLLVTGFDIIPFWVARMLMLGIYMTKQVPFKEVYVTGLIRDHLGQKMSKSKGNVIDPVDLIEGITLEELLLKRTQGLMQPKMLEAVKQSTQEQFPNGIEAMGADALRMTYYSLASPTRDLHFDVNRIIGYRNFCNKLWQVTRFVESQWQNDPIEVVSNKENTHLLNHWIDSRLQTVIQKSEQHFADYRFDQLTQVLYDFVWHDYCDWYVESIKPVLKAGTDQEKKDVRYVLTKVLDTIIILLHPLMPFITETLWLALKKILPSGVLYENFTQVPYPEAQSALLNPKAEAEMDVLKQIIKSIRSTKSQLNASKADSSLVMYVPPGEEWQTIISNHHHMIETLATCQLRAYTPEDDVVGCAATQVGAMTIYVKLQQAVDPLIESKRLSKLQAKLAQVVQQLESRLAHPHFTDKAPVEVVQQSRDQLSETKAQLLKVTQQLEVLR